MSKSMSEEKSDRERFRELFEKIDTNKDGKIEISELVRGLQTIGGVGSDVSKGQAKEIFSKADENKNLSLDFAEFVKYMEEHERKLRLAFSDLDRNKDGLIEPSEIQHALKKLGLSVSMDEAEKLCKKLDQDGNLSVDWAEWRSFFELYPDTDLEKMLLYWRQSLMIDIGEMLTCPPEFTEKERKTGMWWRHLVAGGMAGAVSRTCTAPLDRVKIILQVHGSKEAIGIPGVFKKMIREGGVKSLWRGNGTNVLKIAPESAIKFAAYEQIKKFVAVKPNETSTVERFAAGATAGAIAQTCIYPMEVIKTRLAVSKSGQFKGIIDCGIKVYKENGMRALFKGYIPNLIGIIPYAGIDLTIYETLKQWYIKNHPENRDPGVLVLLACGTLSSTCGQIASYPLALVRTKLQAGVTVAGSPGFVPLATHIVREEGFQGLYRGIAPNFMKVLPAVSISYVIYEKVKLSLGIHSGDK